MKSRYEITSNIQYKAHWPRILSGFILILFVLNGCASRTIHSDTAVQQSDKKNPNAVELFVEGTTHEATGNYSAALLSFQEALIYDSTSANLLFSIAKSYLRLGKEESAMHTLRRCVSLDPDQLEAHELLARIYATQGWWSLVEKKYLYILSRDSTYTDAYYNLALFYMRQNDREKAVHMYQQVLKVQEYPDPQIFLGLGELYLDLGQFDQAEAMYDRLIEYDPQEGFGYYGRGLAQESIGDTVRATFSYRQALQFGPDLLEARERLGRLYQIQEQWQDALDLFKQGIVQDSTEINNWLEMAIVYRRQDDSTSAAEFYPQIIDRFPNRWEARLDYGRFLLDEQNYDKAYPQFKQVANLDTNNAWGWMFAGISLVHLDSIDQSIPYLEQSLRLTPNDPLGNYYLGTVYMQQEIWRKAKPLLQHALKFRPTWISALNALATVCDGMHEYAESDSLYERAIELDPGNNLLLNNFGYSLSVRGVRLDDALDMAKRALEQQPENGAYLDTVGWIYFQLGDYPKAVEHIQRALVIRPEHVEVMGHLGEVYGKMGQTEEAARVLNHALTLEPDNPEIQQLLENLEAK
ncbi:tetratricopeptide repeat protein [candidate division KSB1 bacterium]|nr:tetratricopeptide repeat protein [candidate division KSB1 bacterium]